jgi:hypothetical protein
VNAGGRGVEHRTVSERVAARLHAHPSIGAPHAQHKTFTDPYRRHCCVDGSRASGEGFEMKRRRRRSTCSAEISAFAGFRFPPAAIMLAVRWYLRFGLSYRDLEELLAERGIDVDHVTLFRC